MRVILLLDTQATQHDWNEFITMAVEHDSGNEEDRPLTQQGGEKDEKRKQSTRKRKSSRGAATRSPYSGDVVQKPKDSSKED